MTAAIAGLGLTDVGKVHTTAVQPISRPRRSGSPPPTRNRGHRTRWSAGQARARPAIRGCHCRRCWGCAICASSPRSAHSSKCRHDDRRWQPPRCPVGRRPRSVRLRGCPQTEGRGARYVRRQAITARLRELSRQQRRGDAHPFYALAARRHMETYGTTSEQLGAIAVAQRAWSAMNPSRNSERPLTLSPTIRARR